MIIWDGNYNSFDDAMSNASEKRISMVSFEEQMFDATKAYWRSYELLKVLKENSMLLEANIFAYYHVYGKSLSIADIGGGAGMHLVDMLNANLEQIVKKYYLIEDAEMAYYANRMHSTKEKSIILSGFPNNFSSEIEKMDIDLIYLNCSFQYIFPTETSIEKMKELAPKLICIDRALTGQINTFYTVQKNLKYDTVAKFMNEEDFLNLFEKNGYEVIFKYERNFQWNMDNFIEKMRLSKLPSYILIRKDQTKYKEQIVECIKGYISQGILFFVK